MQISYLDKVLVVLYCVAMVGVGVAVARRVRTYDQFLVAGRSLSAPLLICTLVSTYYGLGVLLAGSEISYETGVVNWFFDTAPAYVMALLTALFLARRIRQSSDFRSVPDIVGAHYGLPARLCTALASFVYSLPAFSIMGIGALFKLLFGTPFEWGLILGSAIALVYTVLGGLLAEALTDAVQFLLMAVTLALAAAIGLPLLGGVGHMEQVLPDHFRLAGTRPVGLLAVYSLTSLSVLIEPAFYQRVFAARSYRTVVVAMLVGVLIWMAYDWTITMLGIGARAATLEGIIEAPASPEAAVTHFVMHVLPAGLKGLFAAGLLATAMSTIDTYLLISSSNLVYDIWNPLRGYRLSDAALVRWTRIVMVISAAANIALCLLFRNVERLWIFITALLICTSLLPVLAALFWRGAKRRAVQAAAVAGLVLVVGYYAWVGLLGEWDADEAAYIWRGELWGAVAELNQDYGILFILPVVAAVFAAAQLWPGDRR